MERQTKEILRFLIADEMSNQFILRRDIHARQVSDGGYICVKKPFTTGLMYLHLRGEITLGAYLLDKEGKASFSILDADDDKGMEELKYLYKFLDSHGAPAYLEKSRRGGHLWMFFREKIEGGLAKGFGEGLLEYNHITNIEVYPKQCTPTPGSLIRVPFGIHKKTGKRYGFLDLGNMRNQVRELANPKSIPMDIVMQYQKKQKEYPANKKIRFTQELIDFIGQYVDLKETSYGAVGLCPFHDDQNRSFAINRKGNYWNCFAGCGGGSIVDFWMQWKKCDFKAAVGELQEMFGEI